MSCTQPVTSLEFTSYFHPWLSLTQPVLPVAGLSPNVTSTFLTSLIVMLPFVYKSPETANSPTNLTSEPSVASPFSKRYLTTEPTGNEAGTNTSSVLVASEVVWSFTVLPTIALPSESETTSK